MQILISCTKFVGKILIFIEEVYKIKICHECTSRQCLHSLELRDDIRMTAFVTHDG